MIEMLPSCLTKSYQRAVWPGLARRGGHVRPDQPFCLDQRVPVCAATGATACMLSTWHQIRGQINLDDAGGGCRGGCRVIEGPWVMFDRWRPGRLGSDQGRLKSKMELGYKIAVETQGTELGRLA